MNIKIGIASDHRGFAAKEKIIEFLDNNDINVVDFFEVKNNGTEVHTVNEPLLQTVRLLEELDELQKKFYLQYD